MCDLSKRMHVIISYLLIIYCLNSVASGVGPKEVITWENTGFSGESRLWYFDPGMRQKLDSNTKWEPIKSIEIGLDLKVAVYRGTSFTGPFRMIENSVNYVGDYWNGAIMSVIIFPKDQAYPLGVTLSQEAPYTITGYEPTMEFFPLPEDLNETEALYRAFARNIDENANYAIIQGDNVEAELFPEHNFEPSDSSLVVSGQLYGPQTKACSSSYDAQGEYNGRKYYRLSGCSIKKVASMKIRWIGPKERSPTQGTSTGGFISEPGGDQTTTSSGDVPRIVDVSWQPNIKAIQVIFDKFPVELWNQKWEMYIDNNKMPVAAPEGSPNIRPNAAFENNPTGVLIGTLPWLSSLSTVDFPCCGTIKFCIPGKGCTNEVQFNLVGDGCKTVSIKDCGSGTKSPPPESADQTPPSGSGMKLEENTDRPGMNYKSYYTSADYHPCYNDCANDPNCKAFTYVKSGFRGSNSQPECWLKDGVPDPVSQEYCISGIKASA
jgi:PAN domain